jgi:hypothetical protein
MKLAKSTLREIIKSVIKENSIIKSYMSRPSDRADGHGIRLTLQRKLTAQTAWYRLETDGWFRRYFNPGKGYGVMLRKIKINESPKWDNHVAYYPMTCFYLPNKFDHPDDDVKSNWKHAYGFICMNRDVYDQFVVESSIRDLESYINNNTRLYKP